MSSSTLWSLAVLALTAAASPFSLIAFGLVLATDRGPRNGIAFILGWITTVTLIGVGTALIGESTDVTRSNTPGAWTLALELALGVLLVAAWVRRRFRPGSTPHEAVVVEKPKPGWEQKIDSMGYVGAFVLGGAVQTWPVMIAAAAEITRTSLSGPESLLVMFVFALATTGGIVILEVLAWRTPGSAAKRLDRMRHYIDGHRDAVVNWCYLLGGLWLAVRGIIGLASR